MRILVVGNSGSGKSTFAGWLAAQHGLAVLDLGSMGFCPPVERLAFAPRLPGERDIPTRFPDAPPGVIVTLRTFRTAGDIALNLPDYEPAT